MGHKPVNTRILMKKVLRYVATVSGIFAGFGGPEHGYFQIQQGHVKPDSLLISSIGPPCDHESAWHLCEPAITVIPNMLITGIVATILGLLTMIWSAFFLHRKHGALILGLLCVALLLVGGGLVPPLIGLFGAATAAWSHKVTRNSPQG
jgi:hypothetical protein